MTFYKAFCACAIVASAMVTFGPANAQDKQSSHSLGSAGDVWRVELRNPTYFTTGRNVGDGDGVGELRWVKVTLRGPDGQYHSVREDVPFVSDVTGSDNGTYVEVTWPTLLRYQRPGAAPNAYDLWLHQRQRNLDNNNRISATPTLELDLEVQAQELDCTRKRLCRRRDTGTVRHRIRIPVPEFRSQRCSDRNTYDVGLTNFSNLVLTPRWGAEPLWTPGVMTNGPLVMINGEAQLCLAVTREPSEREGECDPTDRICREAMRRR